MVHATGKSMQRVTVPVGSRVSEGIWKVVRISGKVGRTRGKEHLVTV